MRELKILDNEKLFSSAICITKILKDQGFDPAEQIAIMGMARGIIESSLTAETFRQIIWNTLNKS